VVHNGWLQLPQAAQHSIQKRWKAHLRKHAPKLLMPCQAKKKPSLHETEDEVCYSSLIST
jgi:hypothetical protein